MFEEYEAEFEERLQLEEIGFSQEILSIEDSVCSLIANSKKGVESVYSMYALEGLIEHYSHNSFNLEESIARCKRQIEALDKDALQFKPDQSQIASLRGLVRKYFGAEE